MQQALRFRLGGARLDKGRGFRQPVTEQDVLSVVFVLEWKEE